MISKGVGSERLTHLQIMAKGRQLKRWLSLAREVAGTALQSAPQLLNATLTVLKARWYGDIEHLQLV